MPGGAPGPDTRDQTVSGGLFGRQASRDPQRESEKPCNRRMQGQRAMRGAEMQVDRAEGLGETDSDPEADKE